MANKKLITVWQFFFFHNYLVSRELKSNFLAAPLPTLNVSKFFRLKRNCTSDDLSQNFYLYLELNELFFPVAGYPKFEVLAWKKKFYSQLRLELLGSSRSKYLKYFFFSLLYNIDFLLNNQNSFVDPLKHEIISNFFNVFVEDYLFSGRFSSNLILFLPPSFSLFSLWIELEPRKSVPPMYFYRWAQFIINYLYLLNIKFYPKLLD